MKKKFATLVITGLFALSSLSTAIAGTWIQDNVGWWYQNDDGSYPTNGWLWIDGNNDGIAERYYFDKVGYCLINSITPDGFYVDSNGAWTTNEGVKTQLVTSTGEKNWSARMPYVSGMVKEKPTDGFFWTVDIESGRYHLNSDFKYLLPEYTRYYAGDVVDLENEGYSSCKSRCCYDVHQLRKLRNNVY